MYEYKTAKLHGYGDHPKDKDHNWVTKSDQTILNELGREGWFLVSVSNRGDSTVLDAFLVRELPAEKR